MHHLEELRKAGRPKPSVNQIELHAFLKQKEIVDYCRLNDIALMAYAPLARLMKADDSTVTKIASRFFEITSQNILNFHVCLSGPKLIITNAFYGFFNSCRMLSKSCQFSKTN